MKKQNRVAFFNILSTLLLQGISIFTAPLFSLLLGTSGYGELNIYSIWVGVLAIAFSLRTDSTLVNARVEYPEERQIRYQSSVMSLSVLTFLGFSAVVLGFLGPVSRLLGLHEGLIILILVQAFGTFCVNFLNNKFTYEFKAGSNMVMSLGLTVTTLVLSVVLILLMPKQVNYLGRIMALAFTYGGLGAGICAYILIKGRTLYNREFWKLCIPLALPAVFYNLSDLALGQSDQVMLREMIGSSAVGLYAYALKFGEIMFTIFTALNNSWVPFFFEDFKQGNREKVRSQAKHFLELFTVLAAGFVLLATEVFWIYAPQDFREGTGLIPIFVSSYFLNFLCTFPVNYEYYYKKTKVVAVVTIASSLVNIGLNYALIRRMGMAGAAVATCMSHGFQFVLHYSYTRYRLGRKGDYPFGIRLWAGYAAAYAAVVALVYMLPEQWAVRWALGAAIGLWELWRIKKRKSLL